MDRLSTEYHIYRNFCTEKQISLDDIPVDAKGNFIMAMDNKGKIKYGEKVWKSSQTTEAFFETYKAIYNALKK